MKDEADIRLGLRAIESQVAETWLAADYPDDMRSDRAQFRHAHIHATKALGKIAALIDHQDHDRLGDSEAVGLAAELGKLLADLVRCTTKMAETAPRGRLSLAEAYLLRADQLAKRWGH